MSRIDANKKNKRWEPHKIATFFLEQIQQNCSCTATSPPSHKSFKLDKQYMLETTGEVMTNSLAMFIYPYTYPY